MFGMFKKTNPSVPKCQNTVRFWCSMEISKKSADWFIGQIINQIKHNVTSIEVYLTSKGGNLESGFELYSFIKTLPSNIDTTVYNMGTVYSSAVPFFLGFRNRFCIPHSNFMVHPVTIGLTSNVNVLGPEGPSF
jgi:ATP-dependent protease ClpP protease subunit